MQKHSLPKPLTSVRNHSWLSSGHAFTLVNTEKEGLMDHVSPRGSESVTFVPISRVLHRSPGLCQIKQVSEWEMTLFTRIRWWQVPLQNVGFVRPRTKWSGSWVTAGKLKLIFEKSTQRFSAQCIVKNYPPQSQLTNFKCVCIQCYSDSWSTLSATHIYFIWHSKQLGGCSLQPWKGKMDGVAQLPLRSCFEQRDPLQWHCDDSFSDIVCRYGQPELWMRSLKQSLVWVKSHCQISYNLTFCLFLEHKQFTFAGKISGQTWKKGTNSPWRVSSVNQGISPMNHRLEVKRSHPFLRTWKSVSSSHNYSLSTGCLCPNADEHSRIECIISGARENF